jgi:hypothetical protein
VRAAWRASERPQSPKGLSLFDNRPAEEPDLPDRRQPLRAQDSGDPPRAQDNSVELVFTPIYASFLNRIECRFWAMAGFVVNNTDYPESPPDR